MVLFIIFYECSGRVNTLDNLMDKNLIKNLAPIKK